MRLLTDGPTRPTSLVGVAAAIALAVMIAGCGDLATQGRSPAQLVIVNISAAAGFDRDQLGGFLNSDVITVRRNVPTIFNDFGRATFKLVLKDQGYPGLGTSPTVLNQISLTRYRVRYVRSDRPGGGQGGVDVPHAFESGLSQTVPAVDAVAIEFELVRHVAKMESPLAELRFNNSVISTIAEITFFGHDQAGNDVSVTGNIGVSFGNFGDPQE